MDGYALDGHIEHRYDAEFAARAAGVELLKKFSVLQINIRRCDEDGGFAEIKRYLSY